MLTLVNNVSKKLQQKTSPEDIFICIFCRGLKLFCNQDSIKNLSPNVVNSLPTLITFTNSSDPDQAGHFVSSNLDSNCLALMYLKKIKKVNFEKNNLYTTKT